MYNNKINEIFYNGGSFESDDSKDPLAIKMRIKWSSNIARIIPSQT